MAQYSRKLKKGTKWWYKFSFNGKTYISKCIYLSKFEARIAENAKYEELTAKERNPLEKPILSLLEAINSRLDNVQVRKSTRYYQENKGYYKILLDRFGDIDISEIKKADINALLLEVSKTSKAKGKDNYTVNSMLRVFKALFNHAISEHDLEMKNPCVGIKPFSLTRKLKYIPSDADIEAVKALCDTNQKKLIDFVMATGCRIDEALRLTAADVLTDYIVLYTRKSVNSDLVPRKVPRPEGLTVIGLKPHDRVFSFWDSRPKFLEHKVKKLGQVNWNWHNLRHRYASMLSKQGKPLYEIMSLLGHSNLQTTQGYLQMLM